MVEEFSQEGFVPCPTVGGIRQVERIQDYFAPGADKVSIGTAAYQDVELVRRAADLFGCSARSSALTRAGTRMAGNQRFSQQYEN